MSGLESIDLSLQTASPPRITNHRVRSSFRHPRWSEFQAAVQILIAHRETSAAESLIRDLLRADSHDALALKALAQSALARQNLALGRAALVALCQVSEDPEALLDLAHCLYDEGHDEEALRQYFRVVRRLPENHDGLFSVFKNIGNIFVRSRDFDSAEENYNRAFRLNPNSSALLVNFGTLEVQRENWSLAQERFRDAISHDERNDKAWIGLAIVHRQFGDLDLSWAALKRTLDLNPSNETAIHLGLSWAQNEHHWRTLIPHLQEYLAAKGDDFVISLALAQIFYLTGQLLAAQLEAERALNLDPLAVSAAELMQQIRSEQQRTQERWG